MTVWYHQSTILKCKSALRIAGLIAVCVAFITTLFLSSATYAAPGINQTLSFQGRLLTSAGGVVPDGYYNMQFKIYEGGTASGGGTEKWSEAYTNNNANAGVNVKNGYFSVNLGSKTAFASLVNWNDDTLYLSMNIAGNSPSCTTFASCSPDGEMTPMKRITSVPFAINSAQLGGRTADGFIQNGTSPQTADFNIVGTGTATSLQAGNLDTASAGTLTLGGTNATSITMADDVTVAAGKSLTLAGGNTASRPASPSEGTLYYDTATKQLLVYANGKWKSDSSSATKIVAASDSSQSTKDAADYVADGEDSSGSGIGALDGDQIQINQALSAVSAAGGGTVYLMPGTYTVDASITMPSNVILAGSGTASLVQLGNFGNTEVTISAIDISNTTGATIRNLKLDGRKSLNTNGFQYGINASTISWGTVNNVTVSNFRTTGIFIGTGDNTMIQSNQAYSNEDGITVGGSSMVVTGNTVVDSTSYGIRGRYATDSVFSNNTIGGTTPTGMHLRGGTRSTVVGNAIASTITSWSIYINNDDTSTMLSNNSLGGIAISDNSTSTIYSSQLDHNGKLINKSAGGAIVRSGTDNTTAFQVQNAAGTSALTVNTTSNTVLVAGALDTTTATTLNIGTTTATAINMGTTSGNILTTVNGRALVKSTSGNNSTTAFQVQNASSTALLTADTTNMQVVIGNGSDTITLSSSGISFAGNARGTKQIRLAAEYAGAVLDNGATGANSGTMVSSLDLTNRMNFYRWSASPATSQTYDIVTQVPIPQDFSAWAASNPLTITSRTSHTTDGVMTIELRDSSGTVRCNFTSLTMGSTNSWITNNPTCLSAGTYTPGDYLTIRLRMSSKNSAQVDVGNIVLNYLSNK